jgi:CheY-like chemotaxis protein
LQDMGSARYDPRPLLPLVNGLTVLVVDDDEFIRESTRLLLEDLGARVVTAPDGAIAFDLLGTYAPDLILSDLDMPRMNGYQLVERVRRDPARTRLPVVAVSAFANSADCDRSLAAGFDAHLGKPFGYAGLRGVLTAVMRRQRELFARQLGRLRVFARQARRTARELQQQSRFALKRTPALHARGLRCRCGAAPATTLWLCADCGGPCCSECAFRSDGAFYCMTCADRRLAA